MLEAAIENAFAQKCAANAIPTLKLNVQGNIGWPDRMVLLPRRRVLFIEFKAPGKEPYPKQLHIHKILQLLGHKVQVHDNAERAYEATLAALQATRLSKEGD